ncbi:MAG: ribose-5-phosphate isomerase RpiA [Polyangiaceae bacterium]|nr:ribose-5-phosphate isomerase RpiA [Polyangiaceae bacterium]
MSAQEEAKKNAARAALAYLPESGIVGLGTGSTAKHFIDGVGELIKEGRKFSAVPTSEQSRIQALDLGIPLAPVDGPWEIDVCVDGADEVSDALDLIKGGGAAHTREKIVNYASRCNIIVVDDSKLSPQLGEKWKVPLEILHFAHRATAEALRTFGELSQRQKNGQALITDSGNYVYDLATGPITDPRELDTRLRALPGVVETGLFCQRADIVLIATQEGVIEKKK